MTITAAQLLSEARIKHARLAELPNSARPQTTEEAYQCQSALIGNLLAHYGGKVAGYKIACTNAIAQRQLSVSEPFYGHLTSVFCFESRASVDASQFFMRVVEAEFGFRIGRDLPPKASPHSGEDIADAVEGVVPSIEVVDSRFDDWLTIGALSLIADNACNAAWVHGPIVENWRGFDLAQQPVRVFVNESLVREGNGAAVLGHPLNALKWLANALAAQGIGLERGQYVTTGVTTEVYMAERGDRALADFGDIGQAEVEFV